MKYIFCWIGTQRAKSKSANPSLTLPIPTASSGSENFHPVLSLFLEYTGKGRGGEGGQPVENSSILIHFFLLSSILLVRIAAHLPASLFPRLLLRTVYYAAPMEGARGRRRRRRTSREPEPSVHRISQSPLRDCAGTSVSGNCRARSRRCDRTGSIDRRKVAAVLVIVIVIVAYDRAQIDRDDDAGGGEWRWKELTG